MCCRTGFTHPLLRLPRQLSARAEAGLCAGKLLGMTPPGRPIHPRITGIVSRRSTGRSWRECPQPHRRHGGDRFESPVDGLSGRFRIHHDPGSMFRPSRTQSAWRTKDATACATRAVGVPAQRPGGKIQATDDRSEARGRRRKAPNPCSEHLKRKPTGKPAGFKPCPGDEGSGLARRYRRIPCIFNCA